ncbi:MAG: rRNA pseudouridine synthase [Verrucomicrobia bacterium]|nr:MAG: rRNA pseudouridine synthase [Verrucomicrobiota bacterium]
MIRLQKFLADAGVASRRAAEQIILEGRVVVNGSAVRVLGSKIDPARDEVTVDGKIVKAHKKHYIVLHKPKGCVCSKADEHDRMTVYELLPKEWQIVNSVGRLDFASEGLLFLTNDGDFALKLTHPRYGVRKRYVVTVEGKVDGEMLDRFTNGIFHDGEKLKAERAWLLSATKSGSIVELELAEGKNREVRRLFESQGFLVRRLVRTQIGKVKLAELKPGKWRTLTPTEIKTLLPEL